MNGRRNEKSEIWVYFVRDDRFCNECLWYEKERSWKKFKLEVSCQNGEWKKKLNIEE